MAAFTGHLRRGQFPRHVQGAGHSEIQAAVPAAKVVDELTRKNKKLNDVNYNINIDEISIEAGKQEAELEKGKYTPTEEDLSRLEEELKRLNEQKFGALEGAMGSNGPDDSGLNGVQINEPQIKRLSYTKRDGQN